jgi:hypothetical protein
MESRGSQVEFCLEDIWRRTTTIPPQMNENTAANYSDWIMATPKNITKLSWSVLLPWLPLL